MAKGKDLRALAARATGALLDRSAAPFTNAQVVDGAPPAASDSAAGAPDVRGEPSARPGAAERSNSDSQTPSPRPRHHFAPSHTTDRQIRRDIYDVDPRRILEQGPYIREWDEEGPEFERLRDAVGARGHIDTPLWVRSSGGAGNRQLVLIAGKGRLRAALANRLPWVPVRDFNEIDDRAAVLLQAQENFDRVEMTPAQTAHTFYLMTVHGLSQKEIAALRKKNPGYVSVMVRVGEALQALGSLERLALDRPGALQVRQCQVLAAAGGREPIVAGLRELAALASATPLGDSDSIDADDGSTYAAAADSATPAPGAAGAAARNATGIIGRTALTDASRLANRTPGPSRADRRTPTRSEAFAGRAIRGGRTFRLRWQDADVQQSPLALAHGFVQAFRTEGAELRAALERASNGATDESVREETRRAQAALDSALRMLARLDKARAGKPAAP